MDLNLFDFIIIFINHFVYYKLHYLILNYYSFNIVCQLILYLQ